MPPPAPPRRRRPCEVDHGEYRPIKERNYDDFAAPIAKILACNIFRKVGTRSGLHFRKIGMLFQVIGIRNG